MSTKEEYILCIYSCKKNIIKANILYNLINNKIVNCKVFIIYGDPTIEISCTVDDKFIILNCGDYYEHLAEKSLKLYHTIVDLFPSIKGVFKCDDDILPNLGSINAFIGWIKQYNEINYFGNRMLITGETTSKYHYGKCSDSKFDIPINLTRTLLCVGPFYYLSNISLNAIKKVSEVTVMLEDVFIGSIIEKAGLQTNKYPLYTEKFEEIDSLSFHNNNDKIKKLYVRLYGGIGEQLFQVSLAYSLAKQNNMFLILLYSDIQNEFRKTTFKDFNYISEKNVDLSGIEIYDGKKIYGDLISKLYEEDVILDSQFQNELYFVDYRTELIKKFIDIDLCNIIQMKYPNINSSYFIYYRPNNHLQEKKLFDINYNKYFKLATDFILSKDPNAFFYILIDNIEIDNEKYIVFKGLNVIFVENMNDMLQSLYFMSLCEKGGICIDSISWWGLYLNSNPNKKACYPDKWLHIEDGLYPKESF